ncbi:MAG: glycosyltransferase family 4 protein [Gemmatimonadaceae bacterium]|nr:glycosyltransferase family 4 protein [Gemmatimonadaceae bacterium]
MGETRTVRFLVAGARPGAAAGNSVSTDVLRAAVAAFGPTDVLTHVPSLVPGWRADEVDGATDFTLRTQPILVHGEALLSARSCRRTIRDRGYTFGWAVNSRYAGALATAGLPYAIWEPTTIRDELRTVSARDARASGRGTGLGRALHAALLPLDERLEARLYRRARAVLAMSAYTRDRLVETHPELAGRVQVLLHPPSPLFLAALERLGGAERRAPRPPGDPLRLLFVGRVDDPRKNFGLLLDAYADLRAAGCAVSLSVIGPCNDRWRARLRDRVDDSDVILHGAVPVEQLAAAYLSHDVLVLPSIQEGFGIVVAEALHAGLPVISTRCGGPEQMVRESEGGVLTGHARVELVDAIRRLADSPSALQRCSERGAAYAKRTLSTDTFIRRIGEIIESVVPMPRAPGAARAGMAP